LLVDNRPSFDLSIVVRDAEPLEETVEKLSQYTDIPREEIFQKIEYGKKGGAYKSILLQEDISRDMLAVVEANRFDLPGVNVEFRPRRKNLFRHNASHIVGYMGEINTHELKSGKYPGLQGGDYVGKYGIEKFAEMMLSGERGGRQVEVDAKGRLIRVLRVVEPVTGHNIYLSIDQNMQQKAELLMADNVGSLVAIEPDTGKVIVMVSNPSFDQDLFARRMSRDEWQNLISNPHRPMENKVIQAEYPPASTYKIVTAMAGLEERVIDRHTSFSCSGSFEYGNRIFRCWNKAGHGSVNVVDALAVSCDVFFYNVGQRLGVDRLAKYAKGCGLGAPTGIELGSEAGGLVPTSQWKLEKRGVPWQKGETISVCIGQGYNLTTPLQMGVLIAAVANGGLLYRPTVIDKIVSASGEIIRQNEGEVVGKLPISPKNLEIIKTGLWEAVNGSQGTARIARIDGVKVCGKTGTAQVFSRKTEEEPKSKRVARHLRPHAWFVTYGERNGKKVAVSVIVEHGEHGGEAAAPLAREFIKIYFGKDSDEKRAGFTP
jgi:penicillin-binding protein 2